MKLYLDDMREVPNGFVLARNYENCINLLEQNRGNIDEISLDHDLGETRTGYDVCKWIVENEYFDGIKKISIHSANPVGVNNMVQLLDRYLPKNVDILYKVTKGFVKVYRS